MVSLSSPVITIALAERLQSALPKFYATVLVFAVKAKMYFIPSITSKFGSRVCNGESGRAYLFLARFTTLLLPYSTKIKKYIDDIEESERSLKDLAAMATMEGIKGTCPSS